MESNNVPKEEVVFERRVMERRNQQHTEEICLHGDAIRKVIEYVELQKAKEERRQKMFANIAQNVIGWGLIVTIGYTGKAVYELFIKGMKG